MTSLVRVRRQLSVALGLAVAASLTVGISPARAASRPDLAASDTKATSGAAVVGGPLQVVTKAKNLGRKAAPKSKTTFYLSSDAKKGSGDVVLARKATPALKPRASKTVKVEGTIPANVKPADYRIIACADDPKGIKESKESNNCAASKSVVEVIAQADPAPFGQPDPVSVDPVEDESKTVSKTVGKSGGQLDLNVPGDASYSLEVPANALDSSTEITMTALADVTSDPFGGGFVAGVSLEPAGLDFQEPVFLTVNPTQPLAPENETPFSADSDGAGFHLHPLKMGETEAVFPLMHFTIVGLFDASALQRTAQASKPPTSHRHALEQQIHSVLQEARVRTLLNGGDGSLTDAEIQKLIDIGKRYYDRIVRPLLLNAANPAKCASMTAQKEAVRSAILWERQFELLNLTAFLEGRVDESRKLLDKIFSGVECSPDVWTGQVSGTYLNGIGHLQSWAGTVTFEKDYADKYFKSFELKSASVHWTLSGTDVNDCDWSGQGPIDIIGSGGVYADPPGYGFNLGTFDVVDATRTCPPPFGTTTQSYEVLRNVPWGYIYGGPFNDIDKDYEAGDTNLSGSRDFVPPEDPDGRITIEWNLNAG